MEKTEVLEIVQEKYGEVARGERSGCGCGSKESVAAAIGYSEEEVRFAEGANLGLGCGNPLALAAIRPGMTVLDLGSGAGFDAFLAWRKVGPTGRVIGVDMTDDMLALARENAINLGAGNVEFRKGTIESLPVESNSVDLVISNCVINLSPDQPAVFREIARVLRPGGQFAVSDIVLLAELPEHVRNDVNAYVGCISGASPMGEYVRMAMEAGLRNLSIPEIIHGASLAAILAGETSGCCGTDPVATAAAIAVASIKLHGHKN
jgi:SAM-dependent methyltransferase